MLICPAAAALAAILVAGPVASADSAPLTGTPVDGGLDRVVAPPRAPGLLGAPGYGPGPGYAPAPYGPGPGPGPGYPPAYGPSVMPLAGAAPAVRPPAEPKQTVYHLKSKDGVRHDVFVVPISDDPSKPITIPDFGFKRFTVTDKPRERKKHQHRSKRHRHVGKAHRHVGKVHRHHRHR